ncbi:MAG: hypothetical protein AAGB22_00455 [Bacteroidota bacterium]
MGLLQCTKHGEQLIAYASGMHADRIHMKKPAVATTVVQLTITDAEAQLDGSFLVDPDLVQQLDIADLALNAQTDTHKVVALFKVLEPVCPGCVEAYVASADTPSS